MPAAGEFLNRTPRVLARKTQAIKHGTHLRFQRITIASLKFGLNPVIAVGNFRIFVTARIKLRHLLRERFHLLLDVEQVPENGKALFQHRTTRKRQAILRKVSGGCLLGRGTGSFVQRFHSRQHFQQSRFARSIPADEPHALFLADNPVEFLKESLGTEMLSSRRELNHVFRICRAAWYGR